MFFLPLGDIENTIEALPDDFLAELRDLEAAYCATDDPLLQSGFGGGALRWKEERGHILEAIHDSGDLLDVGCANGRLLECRVQWAAPRGLSLVPHGVDISPRLVALAKKRLPAFCDNFHVGNAWNWQPPRRYRYVYSVWDCVPESYFARYCHRLLDHVVEPDGRLILGMYGSRSRRIAPIDLGDTLRSLGFSVLGEATGGNPAVTSFAWIVA